MRKLSVVLVVTAFGLALASCGGGGESGSTTTTTTTATVTPSGAPTIGAASAGNSSAQITFSAPTSNGGGAITGYTATCAGGAATATGTGTASPITVSGLANGTTYSCVVTATNSAGSSPNSATISVTPTASGASSISTASVLCPFSQNTLNTTLSLTSTSSWICSSSNRTLTANGLPDHAIGTFPNANNPNAVSAQSVNFTATLTPTQAAANNTNRMLLAYVLNGVKLDPGTAGTCPNNGASVGSCTLLGNVGPWAIEALGQASFNFGVDGNNAHVQPGGAYHYHGMPLGILTKNGVSDTARRMLLIGWAPDGYPVYARYGYTTAGNAQSALKVVAGSYALKSTPDSNRPPTTVIPMGAFQQDYQYVAGSGDLDECNGRVGVTPEFPAGIYHYFVTDTYPFFSRCWKGTI